MPSDYDDLPTEEELMEALGGEAPFDGTRSNAAAASAVSSPPPPSQGEPQANVEEKKAAFLEAARNWFSCKLDPVKVGNRESHWYEAAVKAYRALVEASRESAP